MYRRDRFNTGRGLHDDHHRHHHHRHPRHNSRVTPIANSFGDTLDVPRNGTPFGSNLYNRGHQIHPNGSQRRYPRDDRQRRFRHHHPPSSRETRQVKRGPLKHRQRGYTRSRSRSRRFRSRSKSYRHKRDDFARRVILNHHHRRVQEGHRYRRPQGRSPIRDGYPYSRHGPPHPPPPSSGPFTNGYHHHHPRESPFHRHGHFDARSRRPSLREKSPLSIHKMNGSYGHPVDRPNDHRSAYPHFESGHFYGGPPRGPRQDHPSHQNYPHRDRMSHFHPCTEDTHSFSTDMPFPPSEDFENAPQSSSSKKASHYSGKNSSNGTYNHHNHQNQNHRPPPALSPTPLSGGPPRISPHSSLPSSGSMYPDSSHPRHHDSRPAHNGIRRQTPYHHRHHGRESSSREPSSKSIHHPKRKRHKGGTLITNGRVSAPSHDMNEGEEGTAQWAKGECLKEGRYEIESYLDSGAFSTVLKAYDRHRKESVAIKVIRAVRKYTESAQIEIDILSQIADKHSLYSSKKTLSTAPSSSSSSTTTSSHHRSTKRLAPLLHIVRYYGHFSASLHGTRHVCLVFELNGCSLYQFIKKNDYRGFEMNQIRTISRQILSAMSFIHSELNLVHTDLKIENILISNDSFSIIPNHPRFGKNYRRLNDPSIRIIDFGGATFEKRIDTGERDEKSNHRIYRRGYRYETINTRQYRSPEVILGIGWDRSSDLWSCGCIFSELYTGELLFATHENLEHLAMIEHILSEKIPANMVDDFLRVKKSNEFFDTIKYRLKWPPVKVNSQRRTSSSERHVKTRMTLSLLIPDDHLYALIKACLAIDKLKRISAKRALKEMKFFR